MRKKIHVKLKFLRLEFHHFLSQYLFFFFLFSNQIILLFSSQIVFFFSDQTIFLCSSSKLQIIFLILYSSSDLQIVFLPPSPSSVLLCIWFFYFWFLELEFQMDKLFHLSSLNLSIWGSSLSPNSNFTDLRC